MLDLYLFNDDETATLFDSPVIQVPADTTELTDDMIRQILLGVGYEGDGFDVVDEEVMTWSVEKVAAAMGDVYCLYMNKVALVPIGEQKTIEQVGEALIKMFGNDSATYKACASFGEFLTEKAVRVLDFPEYTGEVDYRDID